MPAFDKPSEKDLVDARDLTAALWTVLTSRERLLTWAKGSLPKFSYHAQSFTGHQQGFSKWNELGKGCKFCGTMFPYSKADIILCTIDAAWKFTGLLKMNGSCGGDRLPTATTNIGIKIWGSLRHKKRSDVWLGQFWLTCWTDITQDTFWSKLSIPCWFVLGWNSSRRVIQMIPSHWLIKPEEARGLWTIIEVNQWGLFFDNHASLIDV